MAARSAYSFLELAVVAFIVGFGWHDWSRRELCSRRFWILALSLAGFWFVIDQIAVHLGLWAFPQGGTLPIRILSLPLEEYLLFFLHTFVFLILVNQCSKTRG